MLEQFKIFWIDCLYEDPQNHMPVIYSPSHWIVRLWNKVWCRVPEQAPQHDPFQFSSRVCNLISDRLESIKNNRQELTSARTLLEIAYKALRQHRAVEIRANNHQQAFTIRVQQKIVSMKLRDVVKNLAALTKTTPLALLIAGEDESKREAVRMVKSASSLNSESSETLKRIAKYVCSYEKSEYEWSRILFSPLSGYSEGSSRGSGYIPPSAVPQDVVAKIFIKKLEKGCVPEARFLSEGKFIDTTTIESVLAKHPHLRSLWN